MSGRALFALVLVGFVTACGGGLASAKSDFKKGRYGDAKEQLLALEPDVKDWGERRRAEYGLYRGLTHAALGDRAAAGVWLREAKAIEDAHPRTLNDDDRARLNLALESLSADTAPPSP